MVELNRNDLEFILEQIKTSEAHSAGTELSELVTNALVPYGLRTVDGSFNNLGQGQVEFGSADGVMQRLLEAQFRDADIDPRTGLPTSYLQTSGSVYDSDPRTISNLIVDQTIGNPATVISALIALGNEDPYAVLAIPANKIAYDGAVTSFNVAQLAAKSFAVAQASGIQAIIDAAQAVLDEANEAKLEAYAYLNETIGITFAGDTVQIPNVSAGSMRKRPPGPFSAA